MFRRGLLALCLTGCATGCAPVLSALPDRPETRPSETGLPQPSPSPEITADRPTSDTPPPPGDPAVQTPPPASESEAPRPESLVREPELPADPQTAQAAPEPIKQDQAVHTTSLDDPGDDGRAIPIRSDLAAIADNPGIPASFIVAEVGDSIITGRELQTALAERLSDPRAWTQMSKAQKNQHAKEVLEYLIDRQMLIQEARRELKKPKQWDMLKDLMLKGWTDKELPTLIRKMKVADEIELRERLAKSGRSLDEMRETYLLDEMAKAYLVEKVRHKVTEPDLPEVYRYYLENLRRFQRPAQITWHEIYLANESPGGDQDPTNRIAAIRARLLAGDDFEKVARAVSQSPRAAEGGVWKTSPGSFGETQVNEALERLPVGEISPVIATSKGQYLVRVDERRAAGPAPFEQVQGEIHEALTAEHFEKAMQDFLGKLPERVSVNSPSLDSTAYAPKQSRAARARLSQRAVLR